MTENASLTTISIALMLADKAMEHKPLIINGSAAFRKSVLEAAFQANLPISFQNKLLQRALESKKCIGIISCQEDDDSKLERLKKFRGLRKQHFDLVMKIDAMTKEAEELEVKDVVQLSSSGSG